MSHFKDDSTIYSSRRVTTAAGTTTLVNTDVQFTQFIGTSTQTVVLPDATTCTNGREYILSNNSTQSVSVQYNDTTAVATISAGTQMRFVLLDNGTSNGVWDFLSSGGSGGGGMSIVSAVSSSSGTFNTGSSTFTDVTNLSVTLTTTGHEVFLMLIADGDTTTGNAGQVQVDSSSATASGYVAFLEGSTIVSQQRTVESDVGPSAVSQYLPCSSFHHSYTPAAGTYTYKVQARVSTGTGISVVYTKLFAYTFSGNGGGTSTIGIVSKSFSDSPYTATTPSTINIIRFDSSGGASTVVFPAASGGNAGKSLIVEKTSGDFNTISLTTGVTNRVDTISEAIEYVSDGSTWNFIKRTGVSGTPISTSTIDILGASSNPTKGTLAFDSVSFFREGIGVKAIYTIEQSSSGANGSGVYAIEAVPHGSGLTVDTSNIVAGDASNDIIVGVCGEGYLRYSSNWFRVTAIYGSSGGAVGIQLIEDGATSWASSPSGLGSNNIVQVSATWWVPVTGWKAGETF